MHVLGKVKQEIYFRPEYRSIPIQSNFSDREFLILLQPLIDQFSFPSMMSKRNYYVSSLQHCTKLPPAIHSTNMYVGCGLFI